MYFLQVCVKCASTQSRSVEHIISEALGNIEHVLPPGVVCDTCNNYFARKVEGPLLETHWFRHARSRRALRTSASGLVLAARLPANVWFDGARLGLSGLNEKDDATLYRAIVSGSAKSVYPNHR